MSSSGSNASTEINAPLINAIVNNALPLQLTHQSDAASNRSHPAIF